MTRSPMSCASCHRYTEVTNDERKRIRLIRLNRRGLCRACVNASAEIAADRAKDKR